MGFLKFFQCGSLSLSAYSLIVKRVYYKKYCFFHSLEFFQPYSTRIFYKMKSVYFQCTEERVSVSVNYSENNIRSTLTFSRPISENMETFLNRFQIKLGEKLKKKSKKITSPENIPDVNVSLLCNDELVSTELRFQDIFQNNLNGQFRLKINDADYDIYLNYPMVLNMTLPKVLYAGAVAFPETLESQYMDEERSGYAWYKSKNAFKTNNWENCGNEFFYKIKEEDIGYYLKVVCTPKMDEKIGPTCELVSASKVAEFKSLEEIKKRHEFTKNATEPDEFRIISYNILAVTYTQTKEAKTELFTFCNPDYLNFTYRKTLCISELLGYNGDIICLQEVDRSHHSTLELLFSKKDYTCWYHEKEGSREGCMFMYKKKKFDLLSVNQYIFFKELFNNPLLDDIKMKIQGNENLIERLQGISSQIQVVALESSSKDILIIGNTHFYFHPDADHIRLLQGILSWHILQNTHEEIKKKWPDKKCSIILCGDLNSTPECGFHEFLITGSVGSDHIGWKSKEDEAIKDLSHQHSFKMKSAYDNTQYTNYTPLFKGCLDYIYYQTEYLKLKQTVPIPSEEVLSRNNGIPSEFFPSDHVALVADFKFEE